MGEATATLGATTIGPELEVANGVLVQANAAALSSQQVQDAFSAWSQCMSGRGYRYPTPLAAAAQFSLDGVPSNEEIATAVADVDCKAATNLTSIWFSVESQFENAAIARDVATLADLSRQLASERQRASQIVADN